MSAPERPTAGPELTTDAGLTHRQTMAIFGSLLMGLFLAAVDGTIVSTALPTIVGELGGVEQLAWVVTAYLLTSTAATPLFGKLSDLYGRRLLFQVAIAVFVVGSALCGLAQDMWQLIVFRGVQGIGGGGLMALGFTILGDILSPRERGRYMGYFSAVFAAAGVAGPLLGGFFVDHLSWPWIFYVKVPLGIVVFAVVSAVLRLPPTGRSPSIDWPGAGLMVTGVSSLLLVTVLGGDAFPWRSAPIGGLVALTVAATVGFVIVERRTTEPIVPIHLFSIRAFRLNTVISFCSGGAMIAAVVFLPLFLQGVAGVSATSSGLLLAPMMLGVTASSMVTGRLISRTGSYQPQLVVGAVLSLLAGLPLIGISVDTSELTIALVMVVLGLGLGTVMPVLNLSSQNAVPFADLGAATSTVTFTRGLGSSIGVAVLGALLTSRLAAGLDELAAAGRVPPGVDASTLADSPTAIQALDEPLRTEVGAALADAIGAVYLAAVPLLVIVVVLAVRVPELPLRTHAHVARAAAPPPDPGTAARPGTAVAGD